MKLEVLRRFEEGEKLTQIARALGLATSTVASIRVNKDRIRASSQAATPVCTMNPGSLGWKNSNARVFG